MYLAAMKSGSYRDIKKIIFLNQRFNSNSSIRWSGRAKAEFHFHSNLVPGVPAGNEIGSKNKK